MALPLTEQVNPDTEDIDRCGTLAILQKINREDRRVAEAAEKCLEALVPAVEAAAERLARGGRMFYFGAGTSASACWMQANAPVPTVCRRIWCRR